MASGCLIPLPFSFRSYFFFFFLVLHSLKFYFVKIVRCLIDVSSNIGQEMCGVNKL